MPDDLRIPMPTERGSVTSSYRAHRPVLELGTRRLLMAAGGLGLLLLAGMGSWALMSRHPAVVPVIEADSRPLRVKPDNPGGLQVVGADEQSGGPNAMAPAAEAPAPQALRAQTQAAAPTPAPAPAPTTSASPLPDTSAAASRTPANRTVAPARIATAGTLVQLAAVDSEQAAQTEWQRLAKRMPDVLGDRRPVVQRAERDGHAVWRVRTGGFADIADATGFCARVRAKGGNCSIASF